MPPTFLIVDLFCGAGGTTTGFAMASNGIAKVIACVNHDSKAIESHWKNHPEVKHFEEDIRTLDLTELAMCVKEWQQLFPSAKLVLWASLECTNFSKAKGGQPRDADSRTLADHLHRYVHILQPHYIMIENVVEFMSWGPLNEDGKPISRKSGKDFLRWCREMCAHEYLNEWREMNSADFGAYTSRNRLFGAFYRPYLPIVWPEPTHSKKVIKGMFDELEKWKPVRDVLDLKDEGESIFNRKKALSEKTLDRIYYGLIKYVAKGDTAFISKYYSGKPSGKNIPITGPAGTITTADGQALVNPVCLLKYNSTNKNGVHHPPSLDAPSPVIATQQRLGIVQAAFLQHYYGNGYATSTDQPCPTLTTKERCALVSTKDLSSNNQSQSIDTAAGTIMPRDKHYLVKTESYLMPTSYGNNPKSLEGPCPVITANRKHHYIVNPSHGGHSTSTEAPCPVIIARQDKAPLYLVQVENGSVAIGIYDNDSPASIRIKEFMAAFNLVDIKMRMLRVHELLKIQGFPDNYVLCGNQTDQKKFIGNSVVPLVVKVWAEALHEKLVDNNKIKVA